MKTSPPFIRGRGSTKLTQIGTTVSSPPPIEAPWLKETTGQ
jgi:hypothetical protein